MCIRLFFNFLIMAALTSTTSAKGRMTQRPLFKISYDQNGRMADVAEKMLTERYGIPHGFIHREQKKKPCHAPTNNRDSLLHVCLKNSGEHRVLKAETKILKRSFQVLKN